MVRMTRVPESYEIRSHANFNLGDALIVTGKKETGKGIVYHVIREPNAAKVGNGD